MSFSWTGIVLFGLGAAMVLALIAAVDPPVESTVPGAPVTTWAAWNSAPAPRPGDILLSAPTAAALIHEAAILGDASAALTILGRMDDRVRDPANLVHPVRILERELTTGAAIAGGLAEGVAPTPELLARNAALDALERWHDTPLPVEETIAMLRAIEMDEQIAREVEEFFKPCVTSLAGQLFVGAAPDRLAAKAIHSAGGDPDAVPYSSCRLVADAYRDKGRTRAQVRWLLRALRSKPAAADAALEIAEGYLRQGMVRPALVALSLSAGAGGTGESFEKRRAEISGWLSLRSEEAAALEALLAYAEDLTARKRVFDLLEYLGRTGEAAGHRAEIARIEGDPDGLGVAAQMAMEDGDAEGAYALIDEASRLAVDARPWRELLLTTYLSDMLSDLAIDELKSMIARWPDGGYEERLAEVLRWTNRREELADLTFLIATRDEDPESVDEAIALCLVLGQRDRVRELTTLKVHAMEDPDEFFGNLAAYVDLEIPGLPEQALEIARSERLGPDSAYDAIHQVAALRDRACFDEVSRVVLERYPHLREEAGEGLAGGEPGSVGDGADSPEEVLSGVPLADRHFSRERMDLALELYEARLREDPADAHCMKRIGQIRAFGNDPYGAIEIFEQILALGGPEDGETFFLLGEAYFATQRLEEGTNLHRRALAIIRGQAELTLQDETMIAKMLARLGRGEEATAIMERLIVLSGRDPDILLDHTDLLLVLDRVAEARVVLDEVAAAAPNRSRVLRLNAMLLLLEDRFEEALAAADRAAMLNGLDASFSAIRAEALIGLGRLADAAEAYDDVLHRRPRNRSAREARRLLADQLACPVSGAVVRTISVGDDSSTTATVKGSVYLWDEMTRVSGYIEHGRYEGYAFAHRGATSPVRANTQSLGFGVSQRFGDDFEVAAGPDLYADRPGNGVLGGWAESSWASRSPYSRVTARLFFDETLTYPAAAAGLEGRRSGVDLSGYLSSKDAELWLFGRIGIDDLSIRTDDLGEVSDRQTHLEVSIGRSFVSSGAEVQEALMARSTAPVRVGSTVGGEPSSEAGPRLGAWVTWNESRLLDGADLDGPLPLQASTRYVTITGRLEETIAYGLILEAEAYAGIEFGRPGVFTGATAGLTYRPREEVDIRLRGSYGDAFGRPDEKGGSTGLELAVIIRW